METTMRMVLLDYFQEAERKIPINYASRYSSKSGGIQKSAYLPFKVLFIYLFIYFEIIVKSTPF